MKFRILTIACLLVGFICATDSSAQSFDRFSDAQQMRRRQPAQSNSIRRYSAQSDYRVASRFQESAPRTVLSSASYPEFGQPRMPQAAELGPQSMGASNVWIEDQSYMNKNSESGLGEAEYPYVTGDIFGVSRYKCCDEWKGHCQCLELTNTRSNCDCTNPRRAHWGRSDCGNSDSGCQSCVRSAGQTPVSDYFHPQR